MSNMSERVLQQRMRLQLQSMESPSDLPTKSRIRSKEIKRPKMLALDLSEADSHPEIGEARKTSEEGEEVRLIGYRKTDMSPVTNLAHNLFDTNLSTPPSLKLTKKKLSMDLFMESSPSPGVSTDSPSPLTSITNKIKGRLGGRVITRHRTAPDDLEANKENIPVPMFADSPCKVEQDPCNFNFLKSSWNLMGDSSRVIQSPAKEKTIHVQAGNIVSQKRPLFNVLEDENSKDSGYSSQPIEDNRHRKKSRCDPETSMEDIYADVSPSKEGLTVLQRSPCSKPTSKASSDGFGCVAYLDSFPEEDEESPSPRKKITSADDLIQNSLIKRSPSKLFTSPSGMRKLKKSVSMIDHSSPCSRYSNSFKEPPEVSGIPTFGRKKRHPDQVQRSNSACVQKPSFKPTFKRSQSEVAIKEGFEFKDDNDDILPDSYGKFCLPSETGMSKKHPNLRSIKCHTLADLISGKFKDTVNSFRIIDVRYNFEYKGGHIAGAENWQHGEDEEFLSHFVPAEPLDSAPSPGGVKDEKRNIVIFHCEFSSERAPDFYKKLRERDRNVNEHVYPALHYPEIYLLHLGYKEFYNHYPDLCEGGYMEMSDPRYNNELRKMRAKSKSWSGGTVARTGAMARRLGGFV